MCNYQDAGGCGVHSYELWIFVSFRLFYICRACSKCPLFYLKSLFILLLSLTCDTTSANRSPVATSKRLRSRNLRGHAQAASGSNLMPVSYRLSILTRSVINQVDYCTRGRVLPSGTSHLLLRLWRTVGQVETVFDLIVGRAPSVF